MIGQAGERATAAQPDPSAILAKIAAANAPRHRRPLARWRHRCCLPRDGSATRRGRRRPALGCANGGLAGGRQARDVGLQALQRSGPAGRHARTVRLVVAAAGLTNGVGLRLGWLLPVSGTSRSEHEAGQQQEQSWPHRFFLKTHQMLHGTALRAVRQLRRDRLASCSDQETRHD